MLASASYIPTPYAFADSLRHSFCAVSAEKAFHTKPLQIVIIFILTYNTVINKTKSERNICAKFT